MRKMRVVVAVAFAAVMTAPPSFADDARTVLQTTIAELETTLDARIGVLIRDTASDWQWGHREDARFLMASTFKPILCGAVLDLVDRQSLTLNAQLAIREGDILAYAPVTRQYVGGFLTIAELCAAALDMSDNTAANLLIDRIGGVQGVMAYLARIGDTITRLDRKEPDMNVFVSGDMRDTTRPSAMLSTWEAMLLGDGLSLASRVQLAQWMRVGSVTGALIRPHIPPNWQVIDKSGGGRDHTRNIVAMITPPGSAPYFVAIFVSDTPADWATRNAAVSDIAAAVIAVIEARQ